MLLDGPSAPGVLLDVIDCAVTGSDGKWQHK